MQVYTGVRPSSLEDLGVERKPFYTTAEVARILNVSDQHILDRIHAPADDQQHLYAIALGPRTYRVPIGALAQLLGIPPRIEVTDKPLRIDDGIREELAADRKRAAGRPAR